MSALGKFLASAKVVEDKDGDNDEFKCSPEMKLAMYEFLGVAGFGNPDPERVEKACAAFAALHTICCDG